MIYKVILRLIERGEIEGLKEKIEFLYNKGSLTEEEKNDLLSKIREVISDE